MRRGYSLIEVLVAQVLLAVTCLYLVGMFSSVTRGIAQSHRRLVAHELALNSLEEGRANFSTGQSVIAHEGTRYSVTRTCTYVYGSAGQPKALAEFVVVVEWPETDGPRSLCLATRYARNAL